MPLIIGLILSYLTGAIPTAYLFGRIIKGIDIREHGSGNVGATNAFRVLGAFIGVLVLLIDGFKGAAAVVFITDFVINQHPGIDPLLLRITLGMISVLGHSWTVFLKFKGGKGMATTLGVLIGLSVKFPALFVILLSEIIIWLIVFWLGRIVSLASIISAITFPIFFILLRQPLPLIAMGFALGLLIIVRHKSNISRLLHKKEPRIDFKKKASSCQ